MTRTMVVLLGALLTLIAPISSARAVTSEPGVGGRVALDLLNAQRAANGIPAGLSFNDQAAEGCRLHANWMDLNHKIAHVEPPGSPGYTPAGAAAGNSSVLGGVWSDAKADVWSSNPYETAPIHLMQLLGPRLSTTGIWGPCASTWPGYQRAQPESPTLHTYPGNGTSGIYSKETASELPFVPGDFVGLPAGTRTGAHLFVLASGMGSGALSKSSLTGPNGPVEVRTVDNKTPEIGSFLPPGGIILPVKPLTAGNYTASAIFTARTIATGADFAYVGNDEVSVPVRWSFAVADRIAGAANDASDPGTAPRRPEASKAARRVRFGKLRVVRHRLVIPLTVPAAAKTARATIRVAWRPVRRCRSRKCRSARTVTQSGKLIRGRKTFRIPVPRGRWRALVSVAEITNNRDTALRLPSTRTIVVWR